MEPTLRDGDLVVVRERGSYATDDVIAFRLPAGTAGPEGAVIHRIVGGSAAEGFVTRGDNRDADDSWRVAPDDILDGPHPCRARPTGDVESSWRAPCGRRAHARPRSRVHRGGSTRGLGRPRRGGGPDT
jgi:hypothetical protein